MHPVILRALVPRTGFRGMDPALAGLMLLTTVPYTVAHGRRRRAA